jgi:signal transduction histidine kinase
MIPWPPAIPPQRAINGALIALVTADATVSALYIRAYFPNFALPVLPSLLLAVAAIAGLFFLDRAPAVAFALTIPVTAVTTGMLASQLALFTLGRRRPTRLGLIACAVTAFVCYIAPWKKPYSVLSTGWGAPSAVIFAVAPILLGFLTRARSDLAGKLAEIERARPHKEQLLIERALARERADLAREMHDVVSHQVSLIAVQSGALQVTACDEASAQTARTIRALSVQTLDELRQMVGVLRAAGSNSTDLTSHAGIDNIAELVARSGVPAVISTRSDTAVTPSATVQHAIYRAAQEGLTNITKHAPGATATLELQVNSRHVSLTLTNSKPDHPPIQLPGAKHGLLGLRERAELLGGTLRAGHLTSGGYELSMTLPTHV